MEENEKMRREQTNKQKKKMDGRRHQLIDY